MDNKGYIRLSRKFFKNKYWLKERTRSQAEAWLDLIQMARFEAEPLSKVLASGRQIVIERGEIHASLRFLSVRWKWGIMQVRTFLRDCVISQQITQRITQGENIITLCKYEDYNPLFYENNTPDITPDNTSVTHRHHTGNTNTKKENKVKKEKDLKPPDPLSGGGSRFDFSFVREDFKTLFDDWLEYKKNRRETYNTQRGIQSCYSRLVNLSGGNAETAKLVIEQSIANNWAGLFELEYTPGKGTNPDTGDFAKEILSQLNSLQKKS
ncbi:MAG: hypothetical protein LBK58_11630 [Prevotellaceae bacterium]|jgi:hypothetical protein|nr:hypothetical protein [Prevotellaceae bacterium]